MLWHSVMWQYLPAEEQQRVERGIAALGARASSAAPFAHLSLEPTRREEHRRHEFLVVLTTWPRGVRRVLGVAAAHGVPVTWGDQARARVGTPDGRAVEEQMAESSGNDDLKAKMREALERKQANDRGVPKDRPVKEKAHGSEVDAGGPKMHRRKAGGGGS